MKKLGPRLKKSAANSALSDGKEEDEASDDIPEMIVVTDELDLHGTPLEIIPEMIEEFLANAMRLNLPRLHIIHGKGKSRLKHLVVTILKDDDRVAAWHDAPPQFGGWGRTIVEMKTSARDSKGVTD